MKMTIEKLGQFLNNERKVTSVALKRHLFNFGIKERKCEGCNREVWEGFPIPLELHHIDTNHYNNNLENLQVLCPNCHSLHPSFTSSSKIKKKLTIEAIKDAIETSYNIRQVCEKLGLQGKGANYGTIKNYILKYGLSLLPSLEAPKKEKEDKPLKLKTSKRKTKYSTIEEAYKAITKGNYPPDEELLELVWKVSILKLVPVIGVTDNGIRHYCQKRNIPTPPAGYWRKLETGRVEECAAIKKNIFNNWLGIRQLKPFTGKKLVVADGLEPTLNKA